MKLINKNALVAEIKRRLNEYRKFSPTAVSPSRINEDEQILDFINTMQEEPTIPDIVDEHFDEMLDPNIQYASREVGIKAHAEDYSFNVESELFQQLTKEQQGLWRKEIEQACIHGGYGGLNLANDKRYDQEEPVSEKDKFMALSDGKRYLGWLDDANLTEAYQRYADHQIERAYPDLSPNLPRKSRMTLNVFDGTELELAFEAGANWQKQQMMKGAVEATVLENYDGKVLSYDEALMDNKNLCHCCVGDKVKVIIIKTED